MDNKKKKTVLLQLIEKWEKSLEDLKNNSSDPHKSVEVQEALQSFINDAKSMLPKERAQIREVAMLEKVAIHRASGDLKAWMNDLNKVDRWIDRNYEK